MECHFIWGILKQNPDDVCCANKKGGSELNSAYRKREGLIVTFYIAL